MDPEPLHVEPPKYDYIGGATRYERIAVAVLAVLVLVLSVATVFIIKGSVDREDLCRQLGGVPVRGGTCIDKEAVIDL